MGLLCSENCMILTSTVFDWSTRVSDGQTDRQTDRQTDGRNCDSICALSIYAVARKNGRPGLLMYDPPAIRTIKIRLDPDVDADSGTRMSGWHQNLIDWSFSTPHIKNISSKSVHNWLKYASKCQFTPYLLMVKNPGKWSRIHERIRIAAKNNGWPGIVMYYPPAEFSDVTSSGFCSALEVFWECAIIFFPKK